jgi:hypothetical protein
MNEFSLESLFPIFHLVFGAILILTGFKVIQPIKDEDKFNKIKVYLLIAGCILFLGGIVEIIL